MEASVEQLKQGARVVWATGRFDMIAQLTWEAGEALVERVGIGPGNEVLDVACGTGNATIPAAATGAKTIGLDLTPELFEDARTNAANAGVEIEWVEGDAEALPFADGAFDRVLSIFGVMFAPRHEVAAAELARVCAPGGLIGLACWTPEGLVGEMFGMIAEKLPAPPSYAGRPPQWGDESYVRGLLEPHGIEVTCEKRTVNFAADVDTVTERMEEYFGPWKMVKAFLGEAWPSFRGELRKLYARWDATSDAPGVPGEYLLVIGRKPG